MRLLKIGRDASCDIVLHSDKVSGLHAEITVLNNGDILLEDKNSRNGTFIMNKPIKPGTSISIRRGDAIRFADVELMWSQIPATEDNSKFKALYGIGTNFRNDLQITGNTVSRFHATLKIGKDGKTYIQDHSKNGTTVNGSRITFGQNVQVKRNDSIVCGGVPVDVKRFMPRPSVWPKVAAAVAACCVVVAVVFGVKNLNFGKPSLDDLMNATVRVHGQYYVEVTYEDDPFIGLVPNWPQKWQLGWDNSSKQFSLESSQPSSYVGTAFFISKYGELGTNRHVAAPWEMLDISQKNKIRNQMQGLLQADSEVFEIRENLLLAAIQMGVLTRDEAIRNLERLAKSPIKISGKIHYMGVEFAGTNSTTLADYSACQVIAISDDEKKDVALLRLNNRTTPEYIVKKGYFDISQARLDETKLKLQEELMTVGYPALTDDPNAKEINPSIHRVAVSKKPDNIEFQFQGQGQGGQSGSPIIDKNHRLVGILYGGYVNTEFTYGCNIKHLVEIYNQHKVED